jgi:hypothetical protein
VSYRLLVGRVANNSTSQQLTALLNISQRLGLGLILWNEGNGNGLEIWHVESMKRARVWAMDNIKVDLKRIRM